MEAGYLVVKLLRNVRYICDLRFSMKPDPDDGESTSADDIAG